jgi:hypothetical protein
MATFIKNNCECCQPAVCDECCIAPSQLFLAPGSEPQEGMIIVNSFTFQAADLYICPCGNVFDGPCPIPDSPEFCALCESNKSEVLSYIYNPITLNYFASYDPYNPNGEGPVAGYYGPSPGYNFPFAGVYAADPNIPFYILGVTYRHGFFGPSAGLYFQSNCIISETANSLTYSGEAIGGLCYSGPYVVNAQGGTVTITW